MSRRGGYTIIDRGLGIIQCEACGKPTRDHDRIGRCPAVTERLTVGKPPGFRGDGSSPEAIRQRQARERRRR